MCVCVCSFCLFVCHLTYNRASPHRKQSREQIDVHICLSARDHDATQQPLPTGEQQTLRVRLHNVRRLLLLWCRRRLGDDFAVLLDDDYERILLLLLLVRHRGHLPIGAVQILLLLLLLLRLMMVLLVRVVVVGWGWRRWRRLVLLLLLLVILLCHQVLLRVDREELLVQRREHVMRVIELELLERLHVHDGELAVGRKGGKSVIWFIGSNLIFFNYIFEIDYTNSQTIFFQAPNTYPKSSEKYH